jgi:DNA-binding NarL/FixJ family response regulator
MRKPAIRPNPKIRVVLYTEHPFVAAGVRSIVSSRPEFELTACCDSLPAAADRLRAGRAEIVLVHLASRISLSDLGQLASAAPSGEAPGRLVLWGDGIGGEFAYQSMLLGARAVIPGRSSIEALLTTLLNVHRGVLCFEKEVVDGMLARERVAVSKREGQVITLVTQGYKNKAIANALGITEGTVKAYLYKLFRKLGVNDRLDMALYGLKNLSAGERLPDALPHGGDLSPAADVFGPWTLPASGRVN